MLTHCEVLLLARSHFEHLVAAGPSAHRSPSLNCTLLLHSPAWRAGRRRAIASCRRREPANPLSPAVSQPVTINPKP